MSCDVASFSPFCSGFGSKMTFESLHRATFIPKRGRGSFRLQESKLKSANFLTQFYSRFSKAPARLVDNAPSVGIVRCSKNLVDSREKNIQQRAKSLSLAGA